MQRQNVQDISLSDLVSRYIHSNFTQKRALEFVAPISTTLVPMTIANFIEKFNTQQSLTIEEITTFLTELEKIKEDKVHDAIVGIIDELALSIYNQYEKEINDLNAKIDKSLDKHIPLPNKSSSEFQKFKGLLNVVALFQLEFTTREYYGHFFPGLTPIERNIQNINFPLAVNTLILTNRLPKNQVYCGIRFDRPLYPKHLQKTETEKLAIKRGIKNSETYYPYKPVEKLFKGDTGDNTLLATNGKKLLYIRGVKHYNGDAVLASKIATFISKKHFASERLLNNKLAGSRKLNEYHMPIVHPNIRDKRKKHLEEEKNVLPGTGTIDEVLNFIQERDINAENFGISTATITKKSHLSKIDYDCCDLVSTVSKQLYERDILTKSYGGIYKTSEHITLNKQYNEEKLYARLKLSILTRDLLSGLAEKAYTNIDHQKMAITELVNRTNIAFQLFLAHKHSKDFLKRHPNVFDIFFRESVNYINRHFDLDLQQNIIQSIADRINTLIAKIKDEFNITLSAIKIPSVANVAIVTNLIDNNNNNNNNINIVPEITVANGSQSIITHEPQTYEYKYHKFTKTKDIFLFEQITPTLPADKNTTLEKVAAPSKKFAREDMLFKQLKIEYTREIVKREKRFQNKVRYLQYNAELYAKHLKGAKGELAEQKQKIISDLLQELKKEGLTDEARYHNFLTKFNDAKINNISYEEILRTRRPRGLNKYNIFQGVVEGAVFSDKIRDVTFASTISVERAKEIIANCKDHNLTFKLESLNMYLETLSKYDQWPQVAADLGTNPDRILQVLQEKVIDELVSLLGKQAFEKKDQLNLSLE